MENVITDAGTDLSFFSRGLNTNCVYRVYLVQAETRKLWCEVSITSLRVLGSVNTIIGGQELRGWSANERIEKTNLARLRATNDVIECQRILGIGCDACNAQKQ